jgi:maltose alpha-D-glucosyltransferase / alpha-amylase
MAQPVADLFDEAIRKHLEREALVPYLRRQRWFGGKARDIASARFVDWAPLLATPHPAWLAIAEVTYQDGGAERYQLPLIAMTTGAAATATLERPDAVLAAISESGIVACDAIVDDDVCRTMLDAMARGDRLVSRRGAIYARPIAVAAIYAADPEMPVVRLPATHSNSAIALGGRFLLKLFRRIEPGVNPDVEIGQFLARSGADVNVPDLVGTLEYRAEDGTQATLALVQALVASRANAWEHALEELANYFAAVRVQTVPPAPGIASDLARRSIDSMALLGRRTAELHRALAGATTDPDFAPVVNSTAEVLTLAERIRAQAGVALDLLAERCAAFDGETQVLARGVLTHREGLLGRMESLGREVRPFVAIRIHGDYHLGQVLRVHDDFAIIDFEGEPARPLAERRAKQSPLRDVAGMLRSLGYAAHAGLSRAAGDDSHMRASLAPWAQAWETATADAFMVAYLAVADSGAFIPQDRAQLRLSLEMFVLEKALYELDYEMNNRPDWVSVPLAGILSLVSPSRL